MLKKELSTLDNGSAFNYGGINWLKLDEADGAVKALAESIVEKRAFDKDGENNWNTSSLRKYLNSNFISDLLDNGADENDFIEFESDLTADDGLKDYGTSTDKIALISCDDYRKYRDLITLANDWWWTITPHTTSSSYYARFVSTSGSLNYYGAYNGYLGVRPLCNLKSETLVSINNKKRGGKKWKQ